MTQTLRSFIAVEIPKDILGDIRSLQENLLGYRFKVRWVRPENIHLTLKFLGDIPAEDIEPIGKAMTECASECPTLSLAARGIGVFPSIQRPRILWVGLKGDTLRLIEFQKTLDDRLDQIGFPTEERPFKAHLTVGRVNGPIRPESLLEAMNAWGSFESNGFTVKDISLIKSELKPNGAVYTTLLHAPFA